MYPWIFNLSDIEAAATAVVILPYSQTGVEIKYILFSDWTTKLFLAQLSFLVTRFYDSHLQIITGD